MAYGNYNLKRGDNDGKPCDANPKPPKWGGNEITSSPTTYTCATPLEGAAPTIGLPTHVKDMQDDLSELGFLMVGTPDGDFGRGTEWAVREFQIYAKMTQVAKVKDSAKNSAGDAYPADSNNTTVATIPNYSTDYTAAVAAVAASGTIPASPAVPAISKYVDSLESTANGQVYTGRISGVVNEETRNAIEYWLENDYRCPVVIEAWNRTNGVRSTLYQSNIWKYNDMTSTAPRIYFRDFTNTYTYPASKPQSQYHVVSEYVSYLSWSGGRSLPPRHTWTEAEMLPSKLISTNITLQNFSIQTEAIKSTYRVIRAVSEVECIGFFDALNSYDNAFMSLGPCHWTLGIVDSSTSVVSNGELGGFLAYMRENKADAYNLAVGTFGLIPNKDWGADGGSLYSTSSRKYTSWYRVEAEGNDNYTDVPKNESEGNFLKSWHWYFRYSMAGRTIEGWQQGMWDMARIRLRDILDTEWSSTDTTKIGEIFTSERAVAIILRWHIRYPAHMVSSSHAGSKLISTLSRAKDQASSLNWTLPKASWTDAYETALCDALWYYAQQRSSGFQTTISQVKAWPTYAGRSGRNYKFSNGEVLDSTSNPPVTLQVDSLSTSRNSFELETI